MQAVDNRSVMSSLERQNSEKIPWVNDVIRSLKLSSWFKFSGTETLRFQSIGLLFFFFLLMSVETTWEIPQAETFAVPAAPWICHSSDSHHQRHQKSHKTRMLFCALPALRRTREREDRGQNSTYPDAFPLNTYSRAHGSVEPFPDLTDSEVN